MRRLTVVLCIICLLSVSPAAYADFIWEPYGDSFYEEHREEFVLSEEDCYINNLEGCAAYYDQPNGTIMGYLDNGEEFNAYFKYTDENSVQWGCSVNGSGSSYVKMEDLLSVYDYEFFSDHSEEITGSLKERPENADEWVAMLQEQIEAARTESGHLLLLTWNYPHGLARTQGTLSAEDAGELVDCCECFYVDADNMVWGYLFYYYATKDRWVCLTDICNPDLAEAELYTGDIYFEEHGVVKAEIDEEFYAGSLPASVSSSEISSELESGSDASGTSRKPVFSQKALFYILPVAIAAGAVILLLCWPKRNKSEIVNTEKSREEEHYGNQ